MNRYSYSMLSISSLSVILKGVNKICFLSCRVISQPLQNVSCSLIGLKHIGHSLDQNFFFIFIALVLFSLNRLLHFRQYFAVGLFFFLLSIISTILSQYGSIFCLFSNSSISSKSNIITFSSFSFCLLLALSSGVALYSHLSLLFAAGVYIASCTFIHFRSLQMNQS